MKKRKSVIALLVLTLCLVALFGIFVGGASAASTDIEIDMSKGSLTIDETTYTYAGTSYEYTTGSKFILSGSTVNSTTSQSTNYCVHIAADVDAYIVLNGVNITMQAQGTPFTIASGSTGNVTVEIADDTTNTLVGTGSHCAGIEKNGMGDDVGRLTFKGGVKGNGILNVTGGSGAAIGASEYNGTRNIAITGGHINAKANGSAAIGGDAGLQDLYISGGVIKAEGGENEAGIGGGTSYGTGAAVSNITIDGGIITVIGDEDTEDIGISVLAKECGGTVSNVIINGGSVKATVGCDVYNGEAFGGNKVTMQTFANPESKAVSAYYKNGSGEYVFSRIWNAKNHLPLDSTDSNLYAWLVAGGKLQIDNQETGNGNLVINMAVGSLIIYKDTYWYAGTTYEYVNGTPFILKGTTDRYTVTVAKDVNANIELAGVTIDLKQQYLVKGTSGVENDINPILIENDSKGNVKITLRANTTNTLCAGSYSAGGNSGAAISKNGILSTAGTLTIDGKGTLDARTAWSSAAIGASYTGTGTRNIVITDGIINASGGYTGDGIGGNEASNIKISGGTITAKPGNTGIGIGGTTACNVDISNATVTVSASVSGAKGIQGVLNISNSNVTVSMGSGTGTASIYGDTTIKDSTVTISGGRFYAGIQGTDVVIEDSVVVTTGGEGTSNGKLVGSAGINGTNVTIVDSTVTSAAGTGPNGSEDAIKATTLVIDCSSVKADTISVTPVNSAGKALALQTIANPNSEVVRIGSTKWTPVNHTAADSTDTNLYAWAPEGDTAYVGIQTPVVTAPTKKTLTYTGSAQALITAGSTTGGTLYYATRYNSTSATLSSWSTTVPKGTKAGTYYVYYKVVGDGEYFSDVAAKYVTSVIKNKGQSAPTGLVANAETVYGKKDGTISGLTTAMEYSLDGGTTYTKVTDTSMTFAAGSVKVRYAAKTNYNAGSPVTLTIATGSYLTVTVVSQTGVTATSTADLKKVTYNSSVAMTVVISTGFTKQSNFAVYVNGTKATVTNNTFTISNIVENITVTFDGVADVNPPKITGVTDGGSYYVSQKVNVTDDNLKKVTVNGVDYTSKVPFTLAGDKDVTYTIVATDEGGNTVTYKVYAQPIEVIDDPIEGITEANVKGTDIPAIQGVLKEALGVDTDDATDAEKEELQAIIDRCMALLAAISGGIEIDMSKGSLVIYDTYYTFGDFTVDYEAGMEFILTGTTTKYTVTVKKDVDANITLKGVSIMLPYTPATGASGVANNGAALMIEDLSGGDVVITIADDTVNYLQSAYKFAGLQKSDVMNATTEEIAAIGTLTIKGGTKGNGQLNAIGRSAAGIGSKYDATVRKIVIDGGVINASILSGVGVGIGGYNNCVELTINGGTINAKGGSKGAGIGAALYGAYTIDINGGTIVATGAALASATTEHAYGAGIGGGRCSGIYLDGGHITAIGAAGSAGIGSSGYSGTSTSGDGDAKYIRVSNGAVVVAIGGANAAGIGSCGGTTPSTTPVLNTFNIIGGTVTAIAGEVTLDGVTLKPDDIGSGVYANNTKSTIDYLYIRGGSVKAETTNIVPLNKKDGVEVFLNVIENPTGAPVFVNKVLWTPSNHTAADSSDTNLYVWAPAEALIELGPIKPTVTAPTKVDGLQYTGNAQALITAGTTSGGTLLYSLDGINYSETIPTATDVGTYKVYYKVEGDDVYYTDVAAKSISVTISKGTQSAPSGLVFGDESAAGKADAKISGLTTDMEYSLDGGKTWTPVTNPSMTFGAGEVQVRYAATEDYEASEAVTGTIASGDYFTVYVNEDIGFKVTGNVALDKVSYGGSVTITVTLDKGFSKTNAFAVYVAGKKVSLTNDSYTISNITADQYVVVTGVEDLNPPTISGVTDGETYYVSQDVVIEDDNIDTITVNGVEYTGDLPLTLEGDTDTTYTIEVTDKGGNTTTVTVTMKPIETIADPIEDLTVDNVTSDDVDTINEVLDKATDILNNGCDDATQAEKDELQDIIDKCNELLGRVEDVQDAMNTDAITDAKEITEADVNEVDRQTIEDALDDLNGVLDNYSNGIQDNLTDDEKKAVEDEIARLEGLLETLDTAVDRIINVTHALNLDGVIYINQYVTIEGFDGINPATNGGLMIWTEPVTREEATYQNAEIIREGLIAISGKYVQSTQGIAAAQYADVFYLRTYLLLEDGTYAYGPLVEYSVRHYCEIVVDKFGGTEAPVLDVCVSLLHYGAAAQTVFNYNTGDLANKNIIADYPLESWNADLLTPLKSFTTNIEATGDVTNSSKALVLDGAIKINSYYTISGFTAKTAELLVWDGVTDELTVNNVSYTNKMELKSGKYVGSTADIPAARYGRTLFMCAKFVDDAGNVHYSDILAYSPEAYAEAVINKNSNANLTEVAKRMVIYGEYARIYFEEK